ncbi:MAG: NAD(P)H-dependent oxidoreductase [Burkholderiales bacterium]
MNHRVGIIIGSLRKQSLNRKMAHALTSLAPSNLALEIVEIAELPHCNADDEANPPPAVVNFKKTIESLDAVLFVTPEYNRGAPGFLKNAIDVASRPYGKNSWQGKPVGVISVSPGAIGAFGANHQLRQSFVFLDMPAMQQPEAYIGNAAELFNDAGTLENKDTAEFMRAYLAAFAKWVARHVDAR